ncbi:MAG: peptidase dimerization domain-containing protein [Verrucomicrobia bacterium]|nr:peptidase dimerization domain-containing protein [Verrucomicrobiota bacterium]MCH8526822.1 peptidase dimerization domain-containing protein [Kiritimatiellia bacterium]
MNLSTIPPETLRQHVRECRDLLLANLVMTAETAAPTFGEANRVRFLLDRFRESGLDNISSDEVNNAVGFLPGTTGEKTVAVVAHLDTVFDPKENHALSLGPDRVKGIGIGDNSLGAAVLVTLPMLLRHLKFQPSYNLLLLGVSRSLGRGNLGGIRFLLENSPLKIDEAICLEGCPLGRLNYTSVAMMRGEISIQMPDEYDFSRFGVYGAIYRLNDIINRILEIPRPSRPQTSIVFGSIEGGNTFHQLAREAKLRFEVRSESDEVAGGILHHIRGIIDEVRARSGVRIDLEEIAWRQHGGISFDHPLVQLSRDVMRGLDIPPQIGPSMSELAALIAAKIPAVTLGLTHVHNVNTLEETVEIEPMFDGIAQVLGVLAGLDSKGDLS